MRNPQAAFGNCGYSLYCNRTSQKSTSSEKLGSDHSVTRLRERGGGFVVARMSLQLLARPRPTSSLTYAR